MTDSNIAKNLFIALPSMKVSPAAPEQVRNKVSSRVLELF
jgi:hypothetical protein